jgi:cytochrome c oxidase subunit 3
MRLYVLLAASTMLFAAFTSAMVVRRGLSDDWVSMPKPPILLVNTAILLASSLALELARRALKSGGRARFNGWWTAGTALGMLFLGGQALAWKPRMSKSPVSTGTSWIWSGCSFSRWST